MFTTSGKPPADRRCKRWRRRDGLVNHWLLTRSPQKGGRLRRREPSLMPLHIRSVREGNCADSSCRICGLSPTGLPVNGRELGKWVSSPIWLALYCASCRDVALHCASYCDLALYCAGHKTLPSPPDSSLSLHCFPTCRGGLGRSRPCLPRRRTAVAGCQSVF